MSPHQNNGRRAARLKPFAAALACLVLVCLCQASAEADTLTVNGASGVLNPPDALVFVSRTFTNNFNVTAAGQTFDFTFGQFSVPGRGISGESGCIDGPCITLTGALTSPAGPLSFDADFGLNQTGSGSRLDIFWASAPLTFSFTTPEGGSGQFTIRLLDLTAINSTSAAQLFDQLARITVTQFTPGGNAPVPEPATVLLFGAGLTALAARRRKSPARA
jgi:hypothetical protein